MKRVSKLLSICLATLALAFLATGCKEDNKPRITRMNVSPACGVAPVEVIATAYASGGDETGDPLGGNNGLDMNWNYGDGGTGSTSVSYHTYNTPGEYNVIVTATDPGGESASASVPVTVLADSLVVVASTNFPGNTRRRLTSLGSTPSVESCAVDFPAVPGDAVKLAFRLGNERSDEPCVQDPDSSTPKATMFASRQPASTMLNWASPIRPGP
ncbi:MAG: PKD domain-containing protein [bacterium]|nr:PKD domain-containing protein [bacterium]